MWSSQTFVCVLLSLEVKYSQLFVTTATLWWQVTLSQTMLRPWKVSWNLPSMAKIYVALLHNTYRYLAAFFSAKKSSVFLLPVNFSPNVFLSVVHLDSPSRGFSIFIEKKKPILCKPAMTRPLEKDMRYPIELSSVIHLLRKGSWWNA